MAGLPEDLQESFENFNASLENVEKQVSSLLDLNVSEILKESEPLSRAKLNMALAYSVNSLFYMYLRTQGEAIKQHPIQQEIERVKNYMGKIKQFEQSLEKPTQRLDVAAAQRFIQSGLPDVGITDRMKEILAAKTASSSGDGDVQMITEEEAQKSQGVSSESAQNAGADKKKKPRSGRGTIPQPSYSHLDWKKSLEKK